MSSVIDAVSARIHIGDGEDHYDLALILKGLFIEAGRAREALPILDEMIGRYPDDVRVPISKATLHLHFLEDPEEGLRCIDLLCKEPAKPGSSEEKHLASRRGSC